MMSGPACVNGKFGNFVNNFGAFRFFPENDPLLPIDMEGLFLKIALKRCLKKYGNQIALKHSLRQYNYFI